MTQLQQTASREALMAQDIGARVATFFVNDENIGDFGPNSDWDVLCSAATPAAEKGLRVANLVIRSVAKGADIDG